MSTNRSRHEPLGPLLTRTARAVGNMLQKMFSSAGFDVTVEQWVILANLTLRRDGQFQQQLADRTYKDKAAITRHVAGLEKRGLVRRREDREDRRQKRIYITPKGRRLMQELFPIAFKAQQQARQGIASDDLVVFNRVLESIFNNANGRGPAELG